MERLKKIVAIKNVTINEAHFQGHFPGRPVMPGVLIIEGMAQAGGLLLLHEIPDARKQAAISGGGRWREVPAAGAAGHQLRLEVTVLSWRGDFCKIEGKGIVDGQLAAESDADVQDD